FDERVVVRCTGLQVQHTRHGLKAVFDTVGNFLKKNLLAIESVLKPPLVPLPFDSHTQNVYRSLKECEVVLTKFSLAATIDFQYSVRCAITLKNYIHGPSNAVLNQQFRSSKSLFVFEVIGNYRRASMQGEPGR